MSSRTVTTAPPSYEQLVLQSTLAAGGGGGTGAAGPDIICRLKLDDGNWIQVTKTTDPEISQLVFIVDVSGSMGNVMDQVYQAIASAAACGAVTIIFSSGAQEITLETADIPGARNACRATRLVGGGTSYSHGFNAAHQLGLEQGATVVFITDGHPGDHVYMGHVTRVKQSG